MLRMCTEISQRANPIVNPSLVSGIRDFLSQALPNSDQSGLNLKSLPSEANRAWMESVEIDPAQVESCLDELSVADEDEDEAQRMKEVMEFISLNGGDDGFGPDSHGSNNPGPKPSKESSTGPKLASKCQELLGIASYPWAVLEPETTARFITVAKDIVDIVPRNAHQVKNLALAEASISQALSGQTIAESLVMSRKRLLQFCSLHLVVVC